MPGVSWTIPSCKPQGFLSCSNAVVAGVHGCSALQAPAVLRKPPQEGCAASSFGVWGHSAGMAVCHAIHLWVFVASKSLTHDRMRHSAACVWQGSLCVACGLSIRHVIRQLNSKHMHPVCKLRWGCCCCVREGRGAMRVGVVCACDAGRGGRSQQCAECCPAGPKQRSDVLSCMCAVSGVRHPRHLSYLWSHSAHSMTLQTNSCCVSCILRLCGVSRAF